MPPIDPKGLIDDVASRPLFRVRTWLVIFFGAVAWVMAQAFGIAGFNVAAWAGPDSVLTIGELIVGLYTVAAGYFTAKRKPGPIEGIINPPQG